jgi:HK97 family phage prohead protease
MPGLSNPQDLRQAPFARLAVNFACNLKATRGPDTPAGRRTLQVEGWASTEQVDRSQEVIHTSFFRDSLETFKANPQLWWQHWAPMGLWDDVELREGQGLYVRGRMIAVSEAEEPCMALVEEGIVRSMSVGFNLSKPRPECGYAEDGVWHWTEGGDLMEVSLVSIPCNPGATMQVAKSLHLALPQEPEDEEFGDIDDPEERRVRSELKRLAGATEALRNFARHVTKDGGAPSAEVIAAALSPISDAVEIAKAGRVLSDRNRAAVLAARDALNEVLERDDASRGSGTEEEQEEPKGRFLRLVREAPACACGCDGSRETPKRVQITR